MPSTKVAPTLGLDAPIAEHLAAAGVNRPEETARGMADQEYDEWREIMLLSSSELRDLMELVGVKHKSATKLARYAEDYKRHNGPEIEAPRPESRERDAQPSGAERSATGFSDSLPGAGTQRTAAVVSAPASNPSPSAIEIPPGSRDRTLPAGDAASEKTVPNRSGEAIVAGHSPIGSKLAPKESAGSDAGTGAIAETSPIESQIASEAAPAGAAGPLAEAKAGGVLEDELPGEDAEAMAGELMVAATAAAQESGDFDLAVNLFREALALDETTAEAWFGLGFSLYQRDGGNTEEQIECYERAVELDPTHTMARSNLGNLLQTLRQDFDSAEALFREAIRLDATCADAHNHLGWLLQNARKDFDGAEALYRTAVELDPGYADAQVNLGWLLHDVRKDLSGAEEVYRRAIELDPDNYQANYNLGLLLNKRGDLKDVASAEQQYRRAIELDPNNVLALISLGNLLETARDDLVGAEQCYREAIAIEAENANAHNCLGILLESGEPPRMQEAEECYRRALELNPGHASASYNLGLLLELVRRDFAGAEQCYRRTIELEPTNANAHSNLGPLLGLLSGAGMESPPNA